MTKLLFIPLSLALFAVLVFLLFHKLDIYPLARWDEHTNKIVIMASQNRVFSGRLYLPNKLFFEKPPIWYMFSYVSSEVFGLNPFGLRFISVIAALATAAVLFQVLSLSVSEFAALGFLLAFVSSGHLTVFNSGSVFTTHNFRSADPDSLFIFFVYLSAVFFYLAAARKKDIYIILGSVAAGLGVLTKSPLGLIPVITFVLLNGNKHKQFVRKMSLSAFPALILISLWYGQMIYDFSTIFISENINYHLWQRIIRPLEGHNNPFWYYLRILTDYRFFPGWELSVAGFILSVVSYRKNFFIRTINYLFLMLLAVLAVVQTRLAWYLLPLYPAMCIYAGIFLDRIVNRLLKRKRKDDFFIYLLLAAYFLSRFIFGLIYVVSEAVIS